MNLFTNTRRSSQRSAPPQPRTFSQYSTPAVPDSAWASEDFMLGAGMVIIQPATHKVVVIYETQRKFWFLPRGRKDFGESLEQTALREAHEEVCRYHVRISWRPGLMSRPLFSLDIESSFCRCLFPVTRPRPRTIRMLVDYQTPNLFTSLLLHGVRVGIAAVKWIQEVSI